jgi:hypothetical protein
MTLLERVASFRLEAFPGSLQQRQSPLCCAWPLPVPLDWQFVAEFDLRIRMKDP